ncbi:MAG: hypothetical protein ACLFVU_01575 [Phycisphaerae bacterium]
MFFIAQTDGAELMQMFTTAEALGALGAIIAGLLYLTLGYPLYRFNTTLFGAYAGIFLGLLLADYVRDGSPSGLDQFVASFGCLVIGALMGWFLHRMIFAILSFAAVFLLILAILLPGADVSPVGRLQDGDVGIGLLVLALLGGVISGGIAFVHTQKLVAGLTALGGAIVVVNSSSLLISGGTVSAFGAPEGLGWVVLVLWAVILGLAGTGFFLQNWLARALRTRLTPEEADGKGSRTRKGPPKRSIGSHNTVSKGRKVGRAKG